MTHMLDTTLLSATFRVFWGLTLRFFSPKQKQRAALTLASCALCSCTTPHLSSADSGHSVNSRTGLTWGRDAQAGLDISTPLISSHVANKANVNLNAQAKRMCAKMAEDFAHGFKAIPRLSFEHTLPTAPEYKASQEAGKEIDWIFSAAACARTSVQPQEREQALLRAQTGLKIWIETYKPKGNPINETKLVTLLQAADLVMDELPNELREKIKTFAMALLRKQDDFYQGLTDAGTNPIQMPERDSRTWNNWQTWRIALRGVAAVVSGDLKEQQRTRDLIESFFSRNLPDDNPGFDFMSRDALHYHVYNLQAWLTVAWFTPELLQPAQRDRIERALQFLKPYYEKTASHIEFAGSKVPFDIERRQSGVADFQNVPWNPNTADSTLRLARCIFPNIRGWTTGLEKNNAADPKTKFLAALGCEAI